MDEILTSPAVDAQSIACRGTRLLPPHLSGTAARSRLKRAVRNLDDDDLAHITFDLEGVGSQGCSRINRKLHKSAQQVTGTTRHYRLLIALAEALLPFIVGRTPANIGKEAERYVAGKQVASPVPSSSPGLEDPPLTRVVESLRAARVALDELARRGALRKRQRDLERLRSTLAKMAGTVVEESLGSPNPEQAHVIMDRLERPLLNEGYPVGDVDAAVVVIARATGVVALPMTPRARAARRRRRKKTP